MAHDININEATGVASVFVVKEPAWHKLGQIVQNAVTATEAIQLAGLDFQVEKRDLTYSTPMGEQKIIEEKMAVVRTDTEQYLGIVGKNYTPIQNSEVFTFFDSLVDKNEAIYHTAGALGNGERIWVLAKLPKDIIIGNDKIDNYILLHNTHNGSSCITAMMTPIRVVCNNTLTAALQGCQNKVQIRHTANAKEMLKEAYKILGISTVYSEQFEYTMRLLARKDVNAELVKQVLNTTYDKYDKDGELAPTAKRVKNDIMDIFESSVGGQDMKVCKGTAYGLYNAITFYHCNHAYYKTDSNNMNQNFFGNVAITRQKALNNIMELVTA